MVEHTQEALNERALQAIKEELNIGMASAAAALAAMLDRQVTVGVESVRQGDLSVLCDPEVSGTLAFHFGDKKEPAACGVALFRRRDMQRMLSALMGDDPDDSEGMPFDEMNLSAACEVVGQMLSSALEPLAKRAGQPFSPGVFQRTEVERFADLAGLLPPGTDLVQAACRQNIRDVLEGRFALLLPMAFARKLSARAAPAVSARAPELQVSAAAQPENAALEPAAPARPAPEPEHVQPELRARRAQFPNFAERGTVQAMSNLNASLLMGVPLDVSIVIGKTRRKIREILEFGPGTVIDLEKQTGAPAEIIVNGQLLAYGDIIVIGDNYGVRVTEIVGTKELLDSLDEF